MYVPDSREWLDFMELPLVLCNFEAPPFEGFSLLCSFNGWSSRAWLFFFSLSLSFSFSLLLSLSLSPLLSLSFSLSLSFPPWRSSPPAFAPLSELLVFVTPCDLISASCDFLETASFPPPPCLDLPPKSPLLDALGFTPCFLAPSCEDVCLLVSRDLPCSTTSLLATALAWSLRSGFLLAAGEDLESCLLLVLSLLLSLALCEEVVEGCLLTFSFGGTLGDLCTSGCIIMKKKTQVPFTSLVKTFDHWNLKNNCLSFCWLC